MLRVLHTADWHAGKLLAGHNRLGELQAVLQEMVRLCDQESVNVVIVAGDLFDHKIPSHEAEQVVYQALLALAQNRELIIVAGNHDAPGLWRALSPLLSHAGVHVASDPIASKAGGHVTVPATSTRQGLTCAMLPWVYTRAVTGGQSLLGDIDSASKSYAAHVADLAMSLGRDMPTDHSKILAAHMMISNALVGGGEREASLAGMYPVSAANLPALDYIALGHVHRPQILKGSPTPATWYCGSPMQLDFGETGWQPNALMVDLEPGLPAVTHTRPLVGSRRLIILDGSFDAIMSQENSVQDSWVKARVHGPRLTDQQQRQLEQAFPSLAVLTYRRPAPIENVAPTPSAAIAPLPVRDQLAEFWRTQHDHDMDMADLDLFDTLLAEAAGDLS